MTMMIMTTKVAMTRLKNDNDVDDEKNDVDD